MSNRDDVIKGLGILLEGMKELVGQATPLIDQLELSLKDESVLETDEWWKSFETKMEFASIALAHTFKVLMKAAEDIGGDEEE